MNIELKRSLRLFDGLAMVVGIMIGSGIFRTPGLVARQLGRPWLTFVAWLLGGVLAFLGALCFAELATRHPKAGGKYASGMTGKTSKISVDIRSNRLPETVQVQLFKSVPGGFQLVAVSQQTLPTRNRVTSVWRSATRLRPTTPRSAR